MSASDFWERGDAYEQYIGRWSRRVAPRFLESLGVPRGRRWVDVGCGTGALSSAILEACAPASLAGIEPSDGFRRTAAASFGSHAKILAGSARQIPLPDGSADAVVSGLVLNFVENPVAALQEMQRVAVPGGTIAAYVWDYSAGMQMLRIFWDAAIECDPGAQSQVLGRCVVGHAQSDRDAEHCEHGVRGDPPGRPRQ